jgi:diguanylate cyclase
MMEHHIPISPENYAIWFEYVQGQNAKLNTAIENQIRTGKPFTLSKNQMLATEFGLSQPPANGKALNKIQLDMKLLIESLIDKIRGMQAGTNMFSGVLDKCQKSLNDEPNIETITNLVATLIDEAQKIKQSSSSMQTVLDDMSKDVDILKEDLASLELDNPDPNSKKSAFDQQVERLYNTYLEDKKIFSLLLVDIDNFAQFNETFGRSIGDKVLAFLGTLLKKGTKSQDVVVRYGQVKFAIMLPHTAYEGAMAAGGRLCEKVAHKRLTMGGDVKKTLGKITVSIGVVIIDADDNIQSLVERANKTLVLAKELGRNQTAGQRQLFTRD